MFTHGEAADAAATGFDLLHQVGDVEELAFGDLVDATGVEDIHAGVHLEGELGLLAKGGHQAVLAGLNHTVGNLEALHHRDDGQIVVVAHVVVVHIAIVLLVDAVAVGDEERRGDLAFQQRHAADGSQRFLFLEELDVVLVVELAEVVLHYVSLVVNRHIELRAANLLELVEDGLQDGLVSDGHQGLGNDVGDGLQAGALASGHNDYGQVDLLPLGEFCLLEEVAPEPHVHQLALFVEDGHHLRAHPAHLLADALLPFQLVAVHFVLVQDAAHRFLQGDVLDDGPLDITDGNKTFEVFTAEHEQYLHLHLVHLLHSVKEGGGGGDDSIVNL